MCNYKENSYCNRVFPQANEVDSPLVHNAFEAATETSMCPTLVQGKLL